MVKFTHFHASTLSNYLFCRAASGIKSIKENLSKDHSSLVHVNKGREIMQKHQREDLCVPSPSFSSISFLFHSSHKWLWQINSPGLFALLSQSRLLAQQNAISSHPVSFIKAMEINGIQRSHLQHFESKRLYKSCNLAHHWHITSTGLSLLPWYGCCQ